MVKKRPEVLEGTTLKAKTSCGGFFLTMNDFDKALYEIHMELGKSGTCIKTLLHVVGILFSILLQSGMEKEELIEAVERHLKDVKCGDSFYYQEVQYHSCLDFVAKQILERLK